MNAITYPNILGQPLNPVLQAMEVGKKKTNIFHSTDHIKLRRRSGADTLLPMLRGFKKNNTRRNIR